LKYKDLTIEIERTCNLKIKVIPVITGAAGISSKSFRKYLNNITGSTKRLLWEIAFHIRYLVTTE
jgi:hypothetical protein